MLKQLFVLAALAAIALGALNLPRTTFAALTVLDHAPCPEQGSCTAGVQAWALANCDDDGPTCPIPPTAGITCNHAFSIELTEFSIDGELVTYEYELCRIGGAAALSQWSVALGQVDCLAARVDPSALVVGATLNGKPVDVTVGLDPTTQLFGMKIDVPNGVPGELGACNQFAFVLDMSVLAKGSTLDVGCVTGATKAGNQSICRPDRPSPGYACIFGPVCGVSALGTGCGTGFWRNHVGVWPAAFAPADAIASVWSIPACVTDPAIHSGTLLDALGFPGGPGIDGGARILLRAAVAGLLNAELTANGTCGSDYPRSVAEVVAEVDAALASCDRDVMLALAADLEADNNLGCPITPSGSCK